ncbi:hypothetical protein B296_00051922 [Ensete ventricosum]|uniref:VWFA domain-containing protein n=1 Tax=Ensete ventricosum TaxID=4639 RepID=A0A426X5E9_ENSVE|nr:hypothetical protein B296_00051922 [Ensete ventricosum]
MMLHGARWTGIHEMESPVIPAALLYTAIHDDPTPRIGLHRQFLNSQASDRVLHLSNPLWLPTFGSRCLLALHRTAMVLEVRPICLIASSRLLATMICIDNSEWMRNGDYSPSRFQSQADAINLICGAKTQVLPPLFDPSFISNLACTFVCSTPIFSGDGEGGSGFAAAAAAASAGGVSGFDFGVDPNLDPELALALRISMEEERARQEAAAKKAAEEAAKVETGGEQASSSHDTTMSEAVNTSAVIADDKRQNLTLTGTRTARYLAIPSKSITGGRFRPVLAEEGRKKKREKNLVPPRVALPRFPRTICHPRAKNR